MQKVKNLFIIAVYLDSMWFRVDMLLTFICLARSENIRLFQLCEWNSCHVECDNVVYNGHSTYFKIFSIFSLHTHYSFIYSVYSGCCKHRWLFNQTASSCNVLHLKLLHHSDAIVRLLEWIKHLITWEIFYILMYSPRERPSAPNKRNTSDKKKTY